MEEHGNKTIMCSVLFLDIMEYSKKPVSGQIALKDDFNSLLSSAIQEVPLDDRIILDTGDGAAVSFLGDIQDALKVAMSFRQGLLSLSAGATFPLRVRMGINLGPVRLVKDANGQPNIMGDGINVAQRVMGFANDGQILVSRSYFDAVTRLSPDYAALFHHQGSRTDKHVREHEIYAIGYPGELTAARHNLTFSPAPVVTYNSMLGRAASYWQAGANWLGSGLRDFERVPMQKRIALIVVLALPLLLLAALGLKIASRMPAEATRDAVEVVTAVPSAVPAVTSEQAAPAASALLATTDMAAKAESSVEPGRIEVAQATAELPKSGSPKVEQVKPESEKSESMANEKLALKSAKVRTLEQTTAIDAGAKASVSLAIAPWGEVYLDGRMQGVSPPLVELQVVPGKHEVVIRNTTFPAYMERFEIKTGDKIKIKHKFDN